MMGLDCSHDAFHGAYQAFNGLRQKVAEAWGGTYPPHKDKTLKEDMWYAPDEYPDPQKTAPGLFIFFTQSDCGGAISWLDCAIVAKELEELLPKVAELEDGTHNHIQSVGGYAAALKKFIAGCRQAAHLKEPLTFG